MKSAKLLPLALIAFAAAQNSSAQQIGKFVPVPAGSDADHAITDITNTTDSAQKLALLDKFAASAEGDMAMVVDELYVNYFTTQKQYDKAFEYGDKIFALDPGNFTNAINMVRAASEKGDGERLATYGEKTSKILADYKASSPPEGTAADVWEQQKTNTLQGNAENIQYIQTAVYGGVYQTKDPAKRADQLIRFAKAFPDSQYAAQAMGVAASSLSGPKMLDVASSILAKDPNNLGMLLLVSDYYAEKGEELAKAESYATKAAGLASSAPKPDAVTDDQWKQQTSLQKGLALSTLGQVNLQKKNNTAAVKNFQEAAPLLKSDATSYARNQYRLGFAYVNLKNAPGARAAFTECASVDSPYKQYALEKLKGIPATAGARKKAS